MRTKIPNPKSQVPIKLQIPSSKCRRWSLVLGIFLGFGTWTLGFSSDWPQWGGRPMRNMYSPAKSLPDSFGKIEFKPGTQQVDPKAVKNLKWAAKLGSQSYGNVSVAAGKVFV